MAGIYCDIFCEILCVFTLLMENSFSMDTQLFYMDSVSDCDRSHSLGGATVYSHYANSKRPNYPNDIDCRLTFRALDTHSRLRVTMEYFDIPDLSYGLCDDAIYMYDGENIFGAPIREAGGTKGLCGQVAPEVIYSTGQYLTVYFRTDPSGQSGRGFKFTITAFSQAALCSGTSHFLCTDGTCIDHDLVCDSVSHCIDQSDESLQGHAMCGTRDGTIMSRVLSLGISAAVGIVAGSFITIIACTVCAISLCCRCSKKKEQDAGGGGTHVGDNTTTTATHVTINNGTMSPLVSSTYAPNGSPLGYGTGPSGYYPLHPAHCSPFNSHKPSTYTHSQVGSSVYSSVPGYAPPSHPRSYTPTSSRSGRSLHSGSDVRYTANSSKVALPVHL